MAITTDGATINDPTHNSFNPATGFFDVPFNNNGINPNTPGVSDPNFNPGDPNNPNPGGLNPNSPTTTNQLSATPTATTTSPGGLPWAIVLLPTTSAGQSSLGSNRHGLQPESWVYGFFADGDDCQQPIIVGVFAGGPGVSTQIPIPISTNPSPGATVPGAPSNPSAVPSPGTPATTTQDVTGSNIAIVFNRLKAIGYSSAQAAGIVGNLMAESGSGLSTTIAGDSGHAHGIAQWQDTTGGGQRWQALQRYAGTTNPSLDQQVDFIHVELKTTEAGAGNLLLNAKDPATAAVAYMAAERPQFYILGRKNGTLTSMAGYKQRIANAIAVYNQFNNATSSPTTSLTTTPSTPLPSSPTPYYDPITGIH